MVETVQSNPETDSTAAAKVMDLVQDTGILLFHRPTILAITVGDNHQAGQIQAAAVAPEATGVQTVAGAEDLVKADPD